MATEQVHKSEVLLSAANGARSVETVTIASGATLVAGTLVGKVTASGKYIAYADGNVDGSETAAGVILEDCDASAADATAVIIARDAEVKSALLTGSDAAGLADLEAIGIIAR